MTRDELEARLWHHMPRATGLVIGEILADVDAYLLAESGRAAARRRLLATLGGESPSEIPWHLRHAHAVAKQCRLAGREVPESVKVLQREYWRVSRRRQRGAA